MKREKRLPMGFSPLPKKKNPFLFASALILVSFPLLFLVFTPRESSQKKAPLDRQEKRESIKKEGKMKKIDYLLKKGDNIYNLLSEINLDPQEIFDLTACAKNVWDLNRIKVGQSLHLAIDEKENRLIHFQYEIDNESTLAVEQGPSGFKASIRTISYEIKRDISRGTIESSFFVSAVKSGMSPDITLNLADIFSGEIDFHTDIRPGDSFRVLFEKRYLAGEFAGYGRILAAEFKNGKNLFSAIFFEDRKNRPDYYDFAGNSLRRQFLRSPLRYRRISSRFSYRRFHPILKIYRPHLGIDYAAPIGTPVVATANGKIDYAGWKGGYGKFVKIKHARMFVSTYGHLSRFARGIKRGKYVKQGQVIGYVGSTGLSTGPHLDYRLLKNGKNINPQNIKTSHLKSIDKMDRAAFDDQKTEMLMALNKKEPFILTNYFSGTYHLIP